MLKKLNVLYGVLLLVDLAIIPLIGFIFGFDTPQTFIATLCSLLIGHPLIYLIMMLVKTIVVKDYEATRFMPLAMALTIIAGCLVWYLFFHLDYNFTYTISLWYGSVILCFSIPLILERILNKFIGNKSDDGPKIIKNR